MSTTSLNVFPTSSAHPSSISGLYCRYLMQLPLQSAQQSQCNIFKDKAIRYEIEHEEMSICQREIDVFRFEIESGKLNIDELQMIKIASLIPPKNIHSET